MIEAQVHPEVHLTCCYVQSVQGSYWLSNKIHEQPNQSMNESSKIEIGRLMLVKSISSVCFPLSGLRTTQGLHQRGIPTRATRTQNA